MIEESQPWRAVQAKAEGLRNAKTTDRRGPGASDTGNLVRASQRDQGAGRGMGQHGPTGPTRGDRGQAGSAVPRGVTKEDPSSGSFRSWFGDSVITHAPLHGGENGETLLKSFSMCP